MVARLRKKTYFLFFLPFVLTLVSLLLYIPSAKGLTHGEILCIPKTASLEKVIDACPGGNCARILIGLESFAYLKNTDAGEVRPNDEFKDILQSMIDTELAATYEALKELRNVARGLTSNCNYSMKAPDGSPGHPKYHAVSCEQEVYHPIFDNDLSDNTFDGSGATIDPGEYSDLIDPMGIEDPPNTDTTYLLLEKTEDLQFTIEDSVPTPPLGLKPQALNIFERLFDVLNSTLNTNLDGKSIRSCAENPFNYLLSCPELSHIENQEENPINEIPGDPNAKKIWILSPGGGEPVDPRGHPILGFCHYWYYISIYCLIE